jgi:hypothetical protein
VQRLGNRYKAIRHESMAATRKDSDPTVIKDEIRELIAAPGGESKNIESLRVWFARRSVISERGQHRCLCSLHHVTVCSPAIATHSAR